MSDPSPKLRVIDEDPAESAEVVRLGGKGVPAGSVERIQAAPPKEVPERLETEVRESFEGRSIEPGVETILEKQVVAANVEQPWGVGDGRLAGVPYGWFVLILAVLAGAGLWSIRSIRQGEVQLDVQHGAVWDKVAKEEDETRAARKLVERVEEVVAAYLAADTLEEVLTWVRQPERVRPMIEEEWKSHPKRSLEFVRMGVFQPLDLDGRTFWVVSVEVDGGAVEHLQLEQSGEFEVKVDWETHVRRQPMDWDRYVAGRPADALDFRVWAVPDTLYSHEFSDSGRWRCFRLLAPDSDEYLFGYAATGSEIATELEALSGMNSDARAAVILRLKAPAESASPRGVVIEKIVAPRWLILDAPSKDSP
jgi:hypothetical protein